MVGRAACQGKLAAVLLLTIGSIAQLPCQCGTPSAPSLRSGTASDGSLAAQRAFVVHVGGAGMLTQPGLDGTLRLRGGVTGKHRTAKKTKDPAEVGVVPLADSMTNGWWRTHLLSSYP